MPQHEEWTKSLPDGGIVKYVYEKSIEGYSASIEVGQYFKSSRTHIRGPLTREQIEVLFLRESKLRNWDRR